MSASHCALYVVLLLYITVAVCAIAAVVFCLIHEYISDAVSILIGLFSFAGIAGTAGIGFYSTKATRENEAAASERKYRLRLSMAKEIYQNVADSKLDSDSVALLQGLMSDSETSIMSTGFGGASIISDTKFGGSLSGNLNGRVDEILNEYQNNREGMG